MSKKKVEPCLAFFTVLFSLITNVFFVKRQTKEVKRSFIFIF